MTIEDVAQYINDHGLGLTIGTNLFVGELGADKPDAIYLVSSTSPAPDNELPTEWLTIDFYSRYDNSKAGYDILRNIYDMFHRNAHYIIGDDTNVYLSEALGQIDDLDRDVQRRKIWRLQIKFTYIDQAYIS